MIPLEPLLYLFHTVRYSYSHEAPFVLAPAVLFFYLSDFFSLKENMVQDKNKIFFKLRTDFKCNFQTGCSSGLSASSPTPELVCGGECGLKKFSETFLNTFK